MRTNIVVTSDALRIALRSALCVFYSEPDAEDTGNSIVFRGARFPGDCCSLRLLRMLSIDALESFEAYLRCAAY